MNTFPQSSQRRAQRGVHLIPVENTNPYVPPTMRLRYDFIVGAYVVMPEYVHLLLSEPKKAVLSNALQALKLSVSSGPPSALLASTLLRLNVKRPTSAPGRSTTCTTGASLLEEDRYSRC